MGAIKAGIKVRVVRDLILNGKHLLHKDQVATTSGKSEPGYIGLEELFVGKQEYLANEYDVVFDNVIYVDFKAKKRI